MLFSSTPSTGSGNQTKKVPSLMKPQNNAMTFVYSGGVAMQSY